ncbi:MAG TPA: shikimate dehydrogenase [Acidimicrobiia bacterium]|nr:shikimate dehydrogenase [Acidimicrobiia bacterium]
MNTTEVSATTTVAAVIGDPIRHSVSPALHNAAFRATGLDWVFVAFEVASGGASAALDAMRSLALGGLSVTMPHKHDVAQACDELTDDAARLASVNCVVRRADGSLLGDSTDGEGFVRALRDAGHDPAGESVLLLGAGGAARAVAVALGRAGCRVHVAARRAAAARDAAALVAGGVTVEWDERHDAVAAATLVVNATPIGMGGEGESPLRPDVLGPRHVVADLVYHPLLTPLLRSATERGSAGVDGLGMLVHQAALAFERWTATPAPVAVMTAAARAAVASRP